MKKFLIYSTLILLLSCTFNSCTESAEKVAEPKAALELEFKDFGPAPFVFNIEDYTLENETYLTALWSGQFMQLTVMNILPGEDIGLELHDDHDQFIRVEAGTGLVQMGDSKDNLDFEAVVEDDFAIMIPAGKWHNVTNTSQDKPLKLYSIYAPAEHPHGTVHATYKEGIEAEEQYHKN